MKQLLLLAISLVAFTSVYAAANNTQPQKNPSMPMPSDDDQDDGDEGQVMNLLISSTVSDDKKAQDEMKKEDANKNVQRILISSTVTDKKDETKQDGKQDEMKKDKGSKMAPQSAPAPGIILVNNMGQSQQNSKEMKKAEEEQKKQAPELV